MSKTFYPYVRVAIIDDEKKIISLIRKIVDWDKLNCEVIGEAYNGTDGLDLIKKEQPGIVLTDIRMPGMDGISLMREIRNEFPDICFIFISGYNEFEYAQSALNLGALGYVLKPVDKQQVENLIKKGMEQIRQKQENRALKEITSNSMGEYFEVFDSFVNKELYTFYDSAVEDKLIYAIKLNNREEAIHVLDDIFSRAEENKLSFVYIKKLGVEICTSYLKNFIKELNYSKSEVDFSDYLKNCSQVAEIKDSLIFFTDRIIYSLNQHRSNSSGHVIEKVKSYIAENMDKELSLSSISRLVFMNPTYFSELFKKETGKNFVEYVTKCRLNAAKDLLKNSELKMSEISCKIGYESLNYFYKVFKKYEGITPKEYRKLK